MKLLVCSGAKEFAESISIVEKRNIYFNSLSRFEDNEISVSIEKYLDLINEDVLIIQSISENVNDYLMELLFVIDILNRITVKTITLLLTYTAYSRQDRIDNINTSFSFKVFADMFTNKNISKIFFIDLHSTQCSGFFNVPSANLKTQDFILELIKKNNYKNPLLISPDVGNTKNIISLSQKTGFEYSIAIKYRPKANENKILSLVGSSPENKDCIIIDDIIDSAGTICNVAEKLAKYGANNIVAYITHPVLSKKSFDRIKNSYLTHLYISNTINCLNKIEQIKNKVEIFSISDFVLNKILNNL